MDPLTQAIEREETEYTRQANHARLNPHFCPVCGERGLVECVIPMKKSTGEIVYPEGFQMRNMVCKTCWMKATAPMYQPVRWMAMSGEARA